MPCGTLPSSGAGFGPSAAASCPGWRELTSQYGAGSAGSVISTRTARLR